MIRPASQAMRRRRGGSPAGGQSGGGGGKGLTCGGARIGGAPPSGMGFQFLIRCQYALYVRKPPARKPAVKKAYSPALFAGCWASGQNIRVNPPSVAIQPRIVTVTGQRRVHRCSFRRIATPAAKM